MDDSSLNRIRELAVSLKVENKNFFKKLKVANPSKVDDVFHTAHEEMFEEIDCLSCANCCKSISPGISHRDVERMAKGLRVKPSELVEKHLVLDSDGEYVFRTSPCPFLMADNYCQLYEHRPKACREYPHTDRKRIQQIFDLTLKNAEVCPAVFGVIELAKKRFEK